MRLGAARRGPHRAAAVALSLTSHLRKSERLWSLGPAGSSSEGSQGAALHVETAGMSARAAAQRLARAPWRLAP